MNKKLRIGILLEDYMIPSWAFHMLERIQHSSHSEICLVVKKRKQAPPAGNIFQKVWQRRKELAYLLYTRVEDRLFHPSPDAFENKDLKTLIDCPEIEVSAKETKFSDRVLAEDILEIKKHEVDVFVRLGFRILRGDILTCSTYGIWSYHHGDNRVNRGSPPGVWEVLEQWEETGVILQILTENLDGGMKLCESVSATDPLSIKRNLNAYYWKAASFLPRKLEELHKLGEKTFFGRLKEANQSPFFYYNRLYKTPNNRELIKGVVKNYWSGIKRKVSNTFYFDQWMLMFRLNKKEGMESSFFRFKRIVPPKDRFWADPFVMSREGKYYVFLEELIYKKGKGDISVLEIDEKGKYGAPQLALERPYHLSYPFLIEDQDELYMIPETVENESIELYRCTDFPLKWELEETLMDNIRAVDATILQHEGMYWMFANVQENPGASILDELFLFYSDRLLGGSWTPHPQNPIVSDVSAARPAGNIFSQNGKLYRPSQNCAKHYGHGMQIHEILTLNKLEYEERTVQAIFPNWEKDLRGTHTLNADGKLTVIDALVRRRK